MTSPLVPPVFLKSLLSDHDRFWLATHVHPDNDGMGSMLALGLALRDMGKQVCMFYDGDGPASFELLPGFDTVVPFGQGSFRPEAVLILDCHELVRIGAVANDFVGDERLVAIDHHVVNGGLGDIEGWVERDAAATAALVHALIPELPGTQLDADKSTCLYAALVTDTGGFRFSNTTADALDMAADLARHGADPARIAEAFLYRRRPQALSLLARVLEAAQYRLGGRVVLLRVDQRMLDQTGGCMTETEGFVNFFTSVDNVKFVAMGKQEPDGCWRFSLRANDEYDVQRVAMDFAGGGHRKAAGFESDLDIETIEDQLLMRLGRELERGL